MSCVQEGLWQIEDVGFRLWSSQYVVVGMKVGFEQVQMVREFWLTGPLHSFMGELGQVRGRVGFCPKDGGAHGGGGDEFGQ